MLSWAMSGDASARVRWHTEGEYRLRAAQRSVLSLDRQQGESAQHSTGHHRLRIDPSIELGRLKIVLQLDVLTGQIFGETDPTGARYVARREGDPLKNTDGWTTVEPRMIWLQYEGQMWGFEVGQMGAHWGMGLLESDGHTRTDELWVERLGDLWFGDIVDRVRLFVRPFSPLTTGALAQLQLAAGVDHIWQDDHARFLDGDLALRAFGAVHYPGESFESGLMMIYREQSWSNGDQLSLTHWSGFARWVQPLYRLGADLKVEGEIVLAQGQTDRLQVAGRNEQVELFGLGWAVQAQLAWQCPALAVGLEAGYASGDGDPGDTTEHSFTFDPDHRVGLILFPDVLRLLSLRGAERQADPRMKGEPPSGLDLLPTSGAVQNAFYLNPALTWRPGRWRLTLSGVLAWAAQPYFDHFETFQAGGGLRNAWGAKASRFYGTELAFSVSWQAIRQEPVGLALGLQGGGFVPGAALEGEGRLSALASKGVLHVDLQW